MLHFKFNKTYLFATDTADLICFVFVWTEHCLRQNYTSIGIVILNARLVHLPWRWRQHVPLKRRKIFPRDFISQTTKISVLFVPLWNPSRAATNQPSPSTRHIFPSSRPVLLYVSERHEFCSYHVANETYLQYTYYKGHFLVGRECRKNALPDNCHRLSVLLADWS